MFFKKVLYFGAWDDITFLDTFPDTNDFVLVDTQPRSEWDTKDINVEYYRDNFVKEITDSFKTKDYFLKNIEQTESYYKNFSFFKKPEYIDPHLFIFKNGKKTIKYYISTNIIYNEIPELIKDISSADTLYLKGYFPEPRILEYFKAPKKFVGHSNSCYYYNNDPDQRNVVDVLHNFPKLSYFNQFYVYSDNLFKVKNFKEFKKNLK